MIYAPTVLHAPCGDCPFLREGAIQLAPGRVQSICDGLLADDSRPFLCHKTVYGAPAGRKPTACGGSMVWLLKRGRANVQMRLGHAIGIVDFDRLREQFDRVIA